MPSWVEQYPSQQYPVDFKFIEELASNSGIFIHSRPVLERPRQRALKDEEFRTVARDYCILQSPGETSWRRSETQEAPELQIFYSDYVKVPKLGTFDKIEATKWHVHNYLNRWYLQGMTRASVEIIFKRYFDLAIPLSHESTAGHWLPGFASYNVEVKENAWEDRVVLFFDGNVQTSQQSMVNRLDNYHQKFKRKNLGERYLSLWRSRWQSEEQSPAESTEKTGSGISSTVGEKKVPDDLVLSSNGPKLRGRKRRAALRQILSELNISRDTSILGNSAPVGPKARGRLRRRERRRNMNPPEKLKDSKQVDVKDDLEDEGLELLRYETEFETTMSNERWPYDSGELGGKDRSNQSSAALVLDIDPLNSNNPSSPLEADSSPPSLKDTDKVPTYLPLIRIRPVSSSSPKAPSPKKFHLVSYFSELAPKEDKDKGDKSPVWRPREYRTSQVHVADLIDEMEFLEFSSYDAQSFLSVIDCNPGALIPSVASLQQSSLMSPQAANERNTYWQKFAVLTVGFSSASSEFVDLPYSQGYGVVHGTPTLFYRENRYGYFDVDNVSRKSKRPRWRASWRFELTREGGEICHCSSFGHICHDLDTCRYMDRDLIDLGRPYDHHTARDEILSDLLYYAHKPQEFSEVIEDRLHKYYPLYVAPDKASSEESASGKEKSDIETPPEIEPGNEDNAAEVTLPDEALDLVRDKELQNLSESKEKEKAVERTFEMGICNLMGFGVSKTIERGMRIIVTAAKHGCRRGQALSSALITSYGLESSIPDKLLEKWLFEAGTRGSKVALRELQHRFPTRYQEAVVVNRFAGDPRYPELLNYHHHILPHFDLSDTQILSKQIQSALAKITMDQPSFPKDIFAMLRETNPNDSETPYYFVLGSLLHLASLFGFANAVSFLLDAGYDIDAHSSQPFLRTPLLCALSRSHSAVAKILINRGASCEPLIMWADEDKCFTPSPLHYLVNIEDEKEAKELARLLVKKGADVNCKCAVEHFQWQTPSSIPSLRGRSVTPLRWAVIHEKVHLVRTMLSLGAKFAYVEYLNPSKSEGDEKVAGQKGCLLLETPCTDPDILEMFFARARVPGLPSDFQATPLGLLVCEDDGPARRLRPGFEDSDKVIDAIRLLLELQPGFEDIFLWSAVRHDHIDILKFLLEDLGWSVETRWKGLTLLHTAALYGRVDLVRYLLKEGANATAVTETRHLTCLHLIMLNPRSDKTDWYLLEMLSSCKIDPNAKEAVDGLTALHMATRNGKFQGLKYLIQLGADPSIPVTDKLPLLSSGRNGYLKDIPNKRLVFSESLTILGEAVIQYLQDDYYSFDYVADLLVLFLGVKSSALTEADLIIDRGNGITLLHLLAVARDPRLGGKVYERDSYRRGFEEKSETVTSIAIISLLQLGLVRCPNSLVNIKDSQGDTPLHYACAAHQTHNVRTLLASGADPSIRNNFGFNAVEILAWSCIYLGNKTFKFGNSSKPWDPNINTVPNALSSESLQNPLQPSELYQAFEIFEELGHTVDPRLRQLALAWDNAKMDAGESYFSVYSTEEGNHLQLIPEDVGKGAEIEEENESNVPKQREKDTRKYLVAALAGPQRERERAYVARARDEERLAL